MPTLADIISETNAHFGIEDITKHREARRIAAYLARRLTNCKRPVIAAALGWADCTNINYQVHSAELRMARSREYRATVAAIESRLGLRCAA